MGQATVGTKRAAAAELRPSASLPPAAGAGSTRAIIVLLAVAVIAVFGQTCRLDFTNDWDDGENVSLNQDYNPVSFGSIAKYWRRPQANLYVPLTSTAWGLIASIARAPVPDDQGVWLNPYVFHAANVAVHLLAVLVAFAVLRRLVGWPWPAAMGAMLFAIHPVQVEAVAWVTGMKDLLCGVLCLVALWFYLRAADEGRAAWLALSVASYVLAMLAKPSAVALPIAAAAIDVLLLRRPARRVAVPLIVGLALALPVLWVTARAQRAGAMEFVPAWWQRPIVAADALAFYVGKVLFPNTLLPDYGRSPWWLLHAGPARWTWLVSAALAAVTLWAARRRRNAVAAALAWFVAALLPVLGLVPFFFQDISTVADRFLYLAMLSPALLLATVLVRRPTRVTYTVVGFLLAILATQAAVQVPHWHDTQTLFAHELSRRPGSVAGNTVLAVLAQRRGDHQAAAAHALTAARAMPDSPKKFVSIGMALAAQGRINDAMQALDEALRLDPANADARQLLEGLRRREHRPPPAPSSASLP